MPQPESPWFWASSSTFEAAKDAYPTNEGVSCERRPGVQNKGTSDVVPRHSAPPAAVLDGFPPKPPAGTAVLPLETDFLNLKKRSPRHHRAAGDSDVQIATGAARL